MSSTPPRLDRRVQRTRAVLRDALIELIQEKGYDNVSVQDITDRADVNRATFYLHYKDKDELLIKSLQAVYDDLLARLGPLTPDALNAGDLRFELAIIQHVEEYFGFYRAMLGERGAPAFTTHLLRYIASAGSALCRPILPPGATTRLPLEAISHYYAGAQIGLLTWWVENDMPCSMQEAAQMLRDLQRHSILWALGIAEPHG